MEQERVAYIKQHIRDVVDFPKPGIVFKDISPLLANPTAFNACLDWMAEQYEGKAFDTIVSIESRGFIFGSALAAMMRKAFVPVRKPGKLPSQTYRVEYELEYGTNAVEMHCDAVSSQSRVLIVDDVLATGGTLAAAIQLVEKAGGGVIGASCPIELAFLQGRQRLGTLPVTTLVTYD